MAYKVIGKVNTAPGFQLQVEMKVENKNSEYHDFFITSGKRVVLLRGFKLNAETMNRIEELVSKKVQGQVTWFHSLRG